MGTTYTGLDLTKVAPFNSKFSILSVHLLEFIIKKKLKNKVKAQLTWEENLLHLR